MAYAKWNMHLFESISCNFESPCLITTILSHILRYVQHFPNAICCNLVILHGRLFPINASHPAQCSFFSFCFYFRSCSFKMCRSLLSSDAKDVCVVVVHVKLFFFSSFHRMHFPNALHINLLHTKTKTNK